MSRRAGILGLGRRGLAWARTCRDAGWHVSAFDPAPGAHPSGVSVAGTISAAVSRADWVFCCLPDRLELVRMVLQRAQSEAPANAILAVVSRDHDVEAVQSCAIRPAQVVRVDETGSGGIALDVTDRNPPELRHMAEATFAELAAIRSLIAPPPPDDHEMDAESA